MEGMHSKHRTLLRHPDHNYMMTEQHKRQDSLSPMSRFEHLYAQHALKQQKLSKIRKSQDRERRAQAKSSASNNSPFRQRIFDNLYNDSRRMEQKLKKIREDILTREELETRSHLLTRKTSAKTLILLQNKHHKVVQEAVSRYSFQGIVDRLNLLQVVAEIF